MARSVASAEFVRQFGQLRHDAASGPVFVTHHGRDTHVLVDIETYRRITDGADTADRADNIATLEQLGMHLPDALFLCDAEQRVIYANPTASAQANRALATFQGRNVWEAFPEVVGTILEHHIRRTMTTAEPTQVDIPSIYRPGTWTHVESFPVGRGTAIMWRDITSQVRHQRLADVKAAVIAALDLHGGIAYARLSLRGAIEHMGGGLPAMLQLPRERLLQVAMADLLPTSHRVTFRDALEGVLQGGGPVRLVTTVLANNGATIGVILAIVGLRGLYGMEGAIVVATPDQGTDAGGGE